MRGGGILERCSIPGQMMTAVRPGSQEVDPGRTPAGGEAIEKTSLSPVALLPSQVGPGDMLVLWSQGVSSTCWRSRCFFLTAAAGH